MCDPQKHVGPGSVTSTPEAQFKKQPNQFIKEGLGAIATGMLWAALMWTAIAGMSGGFTPEAGHVLAEVADGR